MSRQLTKIITLLFLSFLGVCVLAQVPTAQQIEAFKNLTPAQQEQLARQLGVDISAFNQTQSTRSATEIDPQFPRGTEFDAFGQPLTPGIEEPETDELKLFGVDIFANGPSTFSPSMDVPVPENYIVSPGDELLIRIYGKENNDYRLVVERDGSIVIPSMGPVSVASLSFTELKSMLSARIKKQIIGVDVSVSMGQLGNMQVFVMGEAYKPGVYNVSTLSTVTHALFASGGVTDIASLRNIQVKRAGQVVTTLDLYDLFNLGDSSDDILLRSGDVVFIPTLEKTVTVDGLVRRPAIYELKHEKTLQDVVALAGGALAEGYTNAISVQRYKNGQQIQITADLNDKNTNVVNGDRVRVNKVSPFVADSITLIGAVARPGKYQWRNDMKISSLLGDRQSDLLESADLSYVLVLREKNKNGDIETLQTNLARLAEKPSLDLVLKPNDKVLVFSKIESEVIGDINLYDLAYSEEELRENEKQDWKQRIDEKLFWQSLGLISDDTEDSFEEIENIQQSTLIELSDEEKENVLKYKDSTYFSRKRMLVPVIAKLREQAKFDQPLNIVEVAGEVKVPGLYPLTQNASVDMLIVAAGGLTESAYAQKSEITRTNISQDGGANIEHIQFSPHAVMRGEGDVKILLQSKDRINLFTIPSWQKELKVQVVGEVTFPGEYKIRRGEQLSDLVRRAGGITDYADPNATVFTRESLKQQEQQNLRNLAEELRKQIASESLRRNSGAGSIVSYDEAKKLLRDLTKSKAIGRLVVDFESILAGGESSDIILQDGDKLYVPGRSQSVNVIGEVYVPSSHMYAANLTYEDYVNKSGGFRVIADEGRTYIIRANGVVDVPSRRRGFWFSEDSTQSIIYPGDTIVVPYDSDNVDNMTLWTNATQIVYQLAVAVAAIGSL